MMKNTWLFQPDYRTVAGQIVEHKRRSDSGGLQFRVAVDRSDVVCIVQEDALRTALRERQPVAWENCTKVMMNDSKIGTLSG